MSETLRVNINNKKEVNFGVKLNLQVIFESTHINKYVIMDMRASSGIISSFFFSIRFFKIDFNKPKCSKQKKTIFSSLTSINICFYKSLILHNFFEFQRI